jgi:hypothetical protein
MMKEPKPEEGRRIEQGPGFSWVLLEFTDPGFIRK